MSLADELLADLEDAADRDADEDEDGVDEMMEGDDALGTKLDDEIEEVTEEADEQVDTTAYDRVTSVARLRDSNKFKNMMARVIEAAQRDEETGDDPMEGPAAKQRGPATADPEYQFVVQVNQLAVEIDSELNVIHKFVRDKYSKRFPELESLVPIPLDYLATVRELGNDIQTKGQNRETLEKILQPATVIVVSVTASTSQGQELTEQELGAVYEACETATELQEAKQQIFEYVQKRMTRIAPNLTALLGAGPAAMIMGQAGGLAPLSKMPACNILVLGQQKRTLAGFSSQNIIPHTGYVYYTVTVQSLPLDLRKKAARQYAGKCALAARVDFARSNPDGRIGRQYADQIATKFETWLQPPPTKAKKPLPKPVDPPSKRRGGRRFRKMKEQLGMTEMRKRANRVGFAVIEEDHDQQAIGYSLGQLKQTAGAPGRGIRAAQVDEKSRAKMSKKLHKQVNRANAFGRAGPGSGGASIGIRSVSSVGSRTTAGTASSVSFTPVQGLEIINPNLVEKKVAEANAKYFGSANTFLKVQTPLPGATSSKGTA